jgi:hypothetical protein
MMNGTANQISSIGTTDTSAGNDKSGSIGLLHL